MLIGFPPRFAGCHFGQMLITFDNFLTESIYLICVILIVLIAAKVWWIGAVGDLISKMCRCKNHLPSGRLNTIADITVIVLNGFSERQEY